METEEERRARLENDAAKKIAQVGHGWTKKEKQDWRKMVAMYHTAQVGPGDRGRKKSKKKGINLIWICFGFNLD